MIIAMVAVRVVQSAVNKVINMIAVRNFRVPAIRAMDVLPVVPLPVPLAFIWIVGVNGNRMFVDVVAVGMTQMAAVKIIHVAFMFHRGVSAVWAVNMYDCHE
jgi:hypothetical protein